MLAFVAALVLWAFGAFSATRFDQLIHAVLDALVLEVLVGVVIFFGVLFVEVSGRSGGLEKIGGIVKAFELPMPRTIILVTIGIGVTLESLTGYGVSMFVTIPLLLQILSRTKAIALALVGMSLMTWGALSVAMLLGAAIADVPLHALAGAILLTSGPVAAVLPALCLLIVNHRGAVDFVFAALAGFALVAGIALVTRWVGVEVAGVGGGLAVIALCVFASPSKWGLLQALRNPALLPYGLLIVAIAAQKLLVPYLTDIGIAPSLSTARVSFDFLNSPGIALALVSLVSVAIARTRVSIEEPGIAVGPLLQQVARRSWRALASIFFFLMSARLLIEVGGDKSVAELLAQLGQYPAAAAITLLGAFGAYASGSGVASNALFMPGAVATGYSFDAPVLFAALQHTGGSHFAMASLPVIAILLAALPNREQADERIAMSTGLKLSMLWIAFVITSGWLQLFARS